MTSRNKLIRLRKLVEGHNLERLSKVDDFVYRGSQPTSIEDYLFLQNELGIKSIVNLRSDESIAEEREVCKQLGLNFLNYPMNHLRVPACVEQALGKLQNRTLDIHPFYVHCLYGKDRTGLVCGLYRVRAHGWSKEAAFNEMLEFGFDPVHDKLVKYLKEN